MHGQLVTVAVPEMVPHADLYQALKDHTVVISAVSGDTPIFRPEHFQGLADFQQKFLIDLCVPRSVDPAVENIPGILVYDIDEIKTRTDETVSRRIAAIPAVEAIIDSEMSGFNMWRKELSISPVIQRFKEALEDIRKDELARYLKNASEQESQLAEKITKSMINKIIKLSHPRSGASGKSFHFSFVKEKTEHVSSIVF